MDRTEEARIVRVARWAYEAFSNRAIPWDEAGAAVKQHWVEAAERACPHPETKIDTQTPPLGADPADRVRAASAQVVTWSRHAFEGPRGVPGDYDAAIDELERAVAALGKKEG